MQSIFYNVWTEVRKQEGLTKPIFVFSKGKTICCLSPGCATLYKTVDESEDNRHVQNNKALKVPKIMQIKANVLKIWTIECSALV